MAFDKLNKVAVFYALTFGLALIVRFAVPVVGIASLPLTMLTPSIATAAMLIVLAPEGGGFRKAMASLGLTKAGLKAWPFAILGPAAVFAAAVVLIGVSGMSSITSPLVAESLPSFMLDAFAGFLVGSAFALGEEIGWRGYMLPRMPNAGLFSAMLIVGFLHSLWHLPLLLTTDYYHNSGSPWLVTPLFVVTLTLAGVFYGYLRTWSNSVWPVALAHGAVNSWWNISNRMLDAKTALVQEYVGGESGIVMIAALLLFSLVAFRLISRSKNGPFSA